MMEAVTWTLALLILLRISASDSLVAIVIDCSLTTKLPEKFKVLVLLAKIPEETKLSPGKKKDSPGNKSDGGDDHHIMTMKRLGSLEASQGKLMAGIEAIKKKLDDNNYHLQSIFRKDILSCEMTLLIN